MNLHIYTIILYPQFVNIIYNEIFGQFPYTFIHYSNDSEWNRSRNLVKSCLLMCILALFTFLCNLQHDETCFIADLSK